MRLRPALAIAASLWALASPAYAITINVSFIAPGRNLSGFGTAGSPPTNGNVTGWVASAALLNDVVAAANNWASIYPYDAHTLRVDIGWRALGGDVLAQESSRTFNAAGASSLLCMRSAAAWEFRQNPTRSWTTPMSADGRHGSWDLRSSQATEEPATVRRFTNQA